MWQTEMVEIMRVLLDDLCGTDYTDSTLKKLLVVAAGFVNQELGFAYSTTLATMTITPDPVADGDENFINLTCLKASCLVERSAARKASNEGALVRDGGNLTDLRDRARHVLDALGKNFCKAYEDAKFECKANRPAGAAVMGPIRLFAGGYYGLTREGRTNAWPLS